MRICFVSHWSGQGGAEKSLLEMIMTLSNNGTEVICVAPVQGSLVQFIRAQNIPCYVIPYRWWIGDNISFHKRLLRSMLNLLMVPWVACIIRYHKCSIVYTNTVTVNVGAFAAALLRIPHIWHLHEYWDEQGGFCFDLGERVSTHIIRVCSTKLIASSKNLANFATAKVRVDATPIYPVIDVPQIESSSTQTDESLLRLIVIGTIDVSKGQEDALRVLPLLIEDGIRCQLDVVGSGSDEQLQLLKDLVQELGVDDQVNFKGQCRNIFELIHSSHIVLNCSRLESLGRTTIEAMLMGRPVIGARCAGTCELIQDGLTGLLYEPCDVESLHKKISLLVNNPDFAKRMADTAQTWSRDKFTHSRFLRKLTKVLNDAETI